MPATNRFINISSMSFTPSGGSLTAMKGVQSVSRNHNAQEERGSGDGDFFDTFAGVVASNPSVNVEFLNIAALNGVAVGTVGTLTWTENDARNGATASGGGLIYTLANAVYQGPQTNSPHRKLATATIQFTSYSSDGTTNPLSVTAA